MGEETPRVDDRIARGGRSWMTRRGLIRLLYLVPSCNIIMLDCGSTSSILIVFSDNKAYIYNS